MTSKAPQEKLLTRPQLQEFLVEQGFPISLSTLKKFCSPAINCGPPTEARFGRWPLHSPSKALEWARARLRPDSPETERWVMATKRERAREAVRAKQREAERAGNRGRSRRRTNQHDKQTSADAG